MTKGIIVAEIPERCSNCIASDTYVTFCRCTRRDIEDPYSKPDWCPIRPDPEQIKRSTLGEMNYKRDWNECVDYLERGEKL